jgi:hypothetical protein
MSRARKNPGENAPLLGLADVFADSVWRHFIASIKPAKAFKKNTRTKREAPLRH